MGRDQADEVGIKINRKHVRIPIVVTRNQSPVRGVEHDNLPVRGNRRNGVFNRTAGSAPGSNRDQTEGIGG